MGPFTILPIPKTNESDTTTDNDHNIFSSWAKDREGNNSDVNSRKVNSADILETGIDWICAMFGIIFAIILQ